MKEWQFNILFFVGVGGAIFLLVGPEVGLDLSSNPTALAGVGSILTYILTQKKTLTKRSESTPKRRIRNRPRDDEENRENDEDPGLVRRIESAYGDPDETGKDDDG